MSIGTFDSLKPGDTIVPDGSIRSIILTIREIEGDNAVVIEYDGFAWPASREYIDASFKKG